jgi:t-SNARE complex subunit (syntaxin)
MKKQNITTNIQSIFKYIGWQRQVRIKKWALILKILVVLPLTVVVVVVGCVVVTGGLVGTANIKKSQSFIKL